MKYYIQYDSPVGKLLLASDGVALTGLWIENQKYYAVGLDDDAVKNSGIPVLAQVARWLDLYFAGSAPDICEIPVEPRGSMFRQQVWQILRQIPYGHTITYGNIAREITKQTGHTTSARAVGGAVGHNPISIIIPCHRVMGADGTMTGYAGGMAAKELLLRLEKGEAKN